MPQQVSDSEGGAILARATRDGFISAADRDMLAANLGPQGNAAFTNWLQEKGIPVREATLVDPTADDIEDDTGAEGSLGMPAPFGVNSASDFSSLYQQRMQAADRAAQSEADLRRQTYERAQQQIEANRFGAPSQSELLLRLSSALLSPTRTRGFAGVMGNVAPVLSQHATSQREAEEQRAAALQQLQQQYASQQATGATQQARSQLEALKPLVPLYKPQAPAKVRTGFNPITGELVNMDTGQPVENTALPTLTPDQVAVMSRDPRNKGMRFRTSDGREMEIK